MNSLSPRLLLSSLMLLGMFACKSNTQAAPSAASPANDPGAAVAKIGGVALTNKDLEEFAKASLKGMEREYQQQVYQVRKQALENLIDRRLVEPKAKAAGKTVEEFMKQELMGKVTQPSDAELQATYDQAKAGGQQLPAFDEIKANIANFLMQQRMQGAQKAYYDQLRAEAKVEVLLPPYRAPRVEVAAKGPSKGPKDAPVTIVVFSEFQCPACTQGAKLINEVVSAFPEKVRVVYRDFPLNIHPNAPKAAEAAHCADAQGKYWEMHAKLFENQGKLEVPSLKEYAKALSLDQAKFDKCLDSGEKKPLVDEGLKAGEELAISGTPSFFVNGVPLMLEGNSALESFKSLINEELAKK